MKLNPVFQVNKLLTTAIDNNATDIHLHPEENTVLIKERILGELITTKELPKEEYPQIVNRIKVLSNLSSSNTLQPQDSRISFHANNSRIDMRVSVIPSNYGENIVIRILADYKSIPTLDKIGMNTETLSTTKSLLKKKEGLILTTGPTGSGKTTTLYSLINYLYSNNNKLHVVSIEDPIEYIQPSFTQIQVNDTAGMGFANILRAVLRRDPDIILIGEIRDKETAEIAIRAAMTGHLVFASMHTNTAKSSIARFIDFGIKELLINESLLAVFNQRLTRLQDNKFRSAQFEIYQPLPSS